METTPSFTSQPQGQENVLGETEAREGWEGFVIQGLASPDKQDFVGFWDLAQIYLHSKTVPVSAGLGLKPAVQERGTHPRQQHKFLNFSLTPAHRWEMLEDLTCNPVQSGTAEIKDLSTILPELFVLFTSAEGQGCNKT